MLCPLISFANRLRYRSSENQRNISFMMFRWRVNWDRFDVQASGNCELVLTRCCLSGFCAPRKRWRRAISFIAWSAAGLLTVLGLVLLYFLATWWITRVRR